MEVLGNELLKTQALTIIIGLTFMLFVLVFYIICMWRIYKKAGKPGWAALIPLYNTYTEIRIAGLSGWLLLLIVIPFAVPAAGIVSAITLIYITCKFVASYGKGAGFILGYLFLPFIFIPILAFGRSRYDLENDSYESNPNFAGSANIPAQRDYSLHNRYNQGVTSPELLSKVEEVEYLAIDLEQKQESVKAIGELKNKPDMDEWFPFPSSEKQESDGNKNE